MKATLGKLRLRVRMSADDARYLTVVVRPSPDDDLSPAPEPVRPPPRLRRVSAIGTGRGTGRGGKPAADELTKTLKPYGKRADFIKFIGSREVSVVSVRQQFDMTHANVNGFLTNIHRDHGIGYAKEGGQVRLVLPAGSTWRNIWSAA